MRLKTFISPVFFRPQLSSPALKPLLFDKQPLCWFDALLGGGIHVPEAISKGQVRPLTWLISGAPGTGKTTFAVRIVPPSGNNASARSRERYFECALLFR